MWEQILIIFLLIIINGLFALSEMAVVSSRKSKLELAAKRGEKNADLAFRLADHPSQFLSTIQVGITIIGIFLGIYTGKNLTGLLTSTVSHFDILAPYAYSISVTIILIIVTFVTLIIGELVPKRIALSNPESIAIYISGPMNFISTLVHPFIWVLSRSTDLVIKLFHIKPQSDSQVSEDEIKALIEEGTSTGEIQEIEQDIVENVFYLGDRRIGSLMTHYKEIIWLDAEDDYEANRLKIMNNIHSVYPLCNNDINKVLGIVYIKDVMIAGFNVNQFDFRDVMKPALFFPENVKAYKVLEKFKEVKIHYGIVIDEYGATLGMVTMNDILETIVGDISESIEVEEIVEREDHTWLVDAQISFDDFLRDFEINPDIIDDYGFHTLGGFVLHILNHIPKTGEKFTWNSFDFEIVDMDNKRIDKILVSKIS
jgi:putative hemolysin